MDQIQRTRAAVELYRQLGLTPLPSRSNRKSPAIPSYADHYGPTPVPEAVYARWSATNIQIVTGARSPTPTKIVVVDLDGPVAREAWKRICAHYDYVPLCPWISLTGSDGLHLFYLRTRRRRF